MLAYLQLVREQAHSASSMPSWGPPSILEVYLSYIDADGGRGFDDGTAGEERTLPLQIASLALALRSMEQILHLDILHDEALGRKVPTTNWTARYGIRPFPLLKVFWLLPNWPQVEKMLQRAPEEIDALLIQRLEAGKGGEARRRWSPARNWQAPPKAWQLLNTLEPYGHLFPRRLRGKTQEDSWEKHRREARESHLRWRELDAYHDSIWGGQVGDYLVRWGARK